MNVIITGASRGIGYELVRQFARRDGNQVLAISRNKQKLEELTTVCSRDFPASRVTGIPFDLEDLGEIEHRLLPLICDHFDVLDVMVNNAGLLFNRASDKITLVEIERTFKVNLHAPLLLISRLIPLLKAAERPHVVNIGSMAGFQGSKKFVGLSAYSASKSAIHTLTECLAEEYREEGITFNALALGGVQTEMLAEAFPGLKVPTEPLEMAEFLYDFACKGQDFYNGQVLPLSKAVP